MTGAAGENPDGAARALAGSMLGTAVGDALGLACEGLSARRQALLFPSLARHGFLCGRGMISDDTEHTVMLAQSLIVAGGDETRFARDFAWRLRGWLVALPAGIGMATLRACAKLLIGIPPLRSGVVSAGNGPAMRAAVLGVACAGDVDLLKRLNRVAARITHRDPRAEEGALVVALVARLAATVDRDIGTAEMVAKLAPHLVPDDAVWRAVAAAAASVIEEEPAADFVARLGSRGGVSGFMLHTLPAVLHVWLRHQSDWRGGVEEIIRLGGDTDTTAAILGGIIGARVGRAGIPAALVDTLIDWPRSPAMILEVAARLAEALRLGRPLPAVRSIVLAHPLRNLVFLAIVLAHGFRRLLPPY
ncbi:MAG: ADP-ribosylglycohydrolase family protein [Burkholderiales bacterium]